VRLPYVQYKLLLVSKQQCGLGVGCSTPPEFKDTPWTIYDGFDCFDDDYTAEEMEGILINYDRFLTNIMYEAYGYNEYFGKNEISLPTGIKGKDTNFNYKNDDVLLRW